MSKEETGTTRYDRTQHADDGHELSDATRTAGWAFQRSGAAQTWPVRAGACEDRSDGHAAALSRTARSGPSMATASAGLRTVDVVKAVA